MHSTVAMVHEIFHRYGPYGPGLADFLSIIESYAPKFSFRENKSASPSSPRLCENPNFPMKKQHFREVRAGLAPSYTLRPPHPANLSPFPARRVSPGAIWGPVAPSWTQRNLLEMPLGCFSVPMNSGISRGSRPLLEDTTCWSLADY